MGFLEAGTPLAWPDSLPWLAYVRKHGIRQFLHVYNRIKDVKDHVLKWGDEIEYHLIKLDESTGECAIALVAPEVLADLEADDRAHTYAIKSAWRPEYGAWMVEATPGVPYGNSTLDLRCVERNMAMRRYRIGKSGALPPGTVPLSLVNFPMLGAGTYFTYPPRAPGGPFSRSAYIPDAVISPHPRFGTLTANIRRRRGRKVDIQVPLYRDRKTPVLLLEGGGSGGAAAGAAEQEQQQQGERAGAASGSTAATSAAAAAPAGSTGRTLPLAVTCQDGEPRITHGSILPPTAKAWLESGLSVEATVRADEVCAATPSGCEQGLSSSTSGRPQPSPLGCEVGPAHVSKPGHVHMDAMGFGMGCCCLQVTFQARDLHESRFLYDQLAVLAPLMLALTANAPVWRGRLAATDTRWEVISASVDCRTAAERGVEAPADGSGGAGASAAADGTPLEAQPAWTALPGAENSAAHARRRIRKSRYSSIDAYIAQHPCLDGEGSGSSGNGSGSGSGVGGAASSTTPSLAISPTEAVYNDLSLEYDEEAAAELVASGLDPRLARHVAHLFIRDPLVIFSERTDKVDDRSSTEHFENIQSTNWRSVRWKPPPPDALAPVTAADGSAGASASASSGSTSSSGHSIGWRVELRTMEAQLTDYENAAYTVFIVLLSRVLLFFDLSLYIPLSLVDENLARANTRQAVSRQKFWFRRSLNPLPKHCEPCVASAAAGANSGSSSGAGSGEAGQSNSQAQWIEMSLAEILLGRRSYEAGTGADLAGAAAAAAAAGGLATPSGSRSSREGSTAGLGSPEAPAAGSSAPPAPPAPAAPFPSGDPCGCGAGWGPVPSPPPAAPAASTAAAGGSAGCAGQSPSPGPTTASGARAWPCPPCASEDFPGLVPLILVYLDFIGCDAETRGMVDSYLRFICARARGDIMTGATWQRAFVRSHPDYQQDGVVTPRIATDLMARIRDICAGKIAAPELLGRHAPPPIVFQGHEPEVTPLPHTVEQHLSGGGSGGAAAQGQAGSADGLGLHAHPQSPLPVGAAGEVLGHLQEAKAGSVGSHASHSPFPSPPGGASAAAAAPVQTGLPPRHPASSSRSEADAATGSPGSSAGGGVGVPLVGSTTSSSPTGSTRMRGSSFSAEVTHAAYACGAIQDLVRQHAARLGVSLQPGDDGLSMLSAASSGSATGGGAGGHGVDGTGADALTGLPPAKTFAQAHVRVLAQRADSFSST